MKLPKQARAAVTNGKQLFIERVDGRSLPARRYRDLYLAIIEDIGGFDQTSEAQRQLARRAAAMCVQAELMEAALARGEDLDVGEHCLLTNAQARVFVKLGIKRVPRQKPIMDLHTYLEMEAGEA